MTDTAIKTYWTEAERAQLAQHIATQLRKLVGDAPFFRVTIQPEIVFLKDPSLRELGGSTVDFNIWLRETFGGRPLAAYKGALGSYLQYVETAIHEAAHRVAPLRQPDEEEHGADFAAVREQLCNKAARLGIWPVAEIPVEVRHLFREPLFNKSLTDWILRQIKERRIPPPRRRRTRPD